MNRSNDSSRTVAELRDELLGFTHPSAVRRIASAVRSADEVQALYALLSAGEEPLRVDFLDFCLDAMTDPAQPHAVRMYCMKLACEMCRTQKDLLHEFRTLVELLEPDLLPPSLRAVRRNVLAALDRNRPLPRR